MEKSSLRPGFQRRQRGHRLRDTIRHRRHTQDPRTTTPPALGISTIRTGDGKYFPTTSGSTACTGSFQVLPELPTDTPSIPAPLLALHLPKRRQDHLLGDLKRLRTPSASTWLTGSSRRNSVDHQSRPG